jgi:cytochrome c-type biogenesis protein CcmH/NrfG
MLGTMLFRQGDVGAAIAEWSEVLKRQPDSYALNNLAWVFATYPDSSVRDGTKAVELAKQALDLSGGNAAVLRTLAAAYAESGRFSEAIDAAQRGIDLANSQGDSRLAGELEEEIALYRERLPLHAPRPITGESAP